MSSPPIGDAESQDLEFKAAEALEKPSSIAREVVAMLNAGPGEIWVGVGEREGTAYEIQPIAKIDLAIRRLEDHLMDTIEPSPLPREIQHERVPVGELGDVLRIRVNGEANRRPYALLRQGGRHFLVRVGARIRQMSREEVLGGAAPSGEPAALAELRASKEAIVSGASSLWLGVAFDPSPWVAGMNESVRQVLRDPTVSGNRTTGWTVMTAYSTSSVRGGCMREEIRRSEHLNRLLELCERGTLTFQAPLDALYHKGEKRQLWPWALLEFPVSIARLARALLLSSPRAFVGTLWFDIALTGASEWELLPNSPQSPGYDRDFKPHSQAGHSASDLITLPEPRRFELSALPENPDAWAWPLVRWIYAEFGYDESQIPFEFDPSTRQLSLGG